ncbi:MAG: hypothetical protein IJX76_03075 [Clostridia bacterium]|nr:hypothetical protein [Clostridia bacterium]
MNRQEFIEALRQRLTAEGFPQEYVDTQCNALIEKLNGLPDETADQYTTARNLDIIVRKLVSQDADQLVVSAPETSEIPEDAETIAPEQIDPTPSAPPVTADPAASRADVQFVDEASLSPDRRSPRTVADAEYITCDKPRLLMLALAAICAPTILFVLLGSFGLFALVFMALAAAICLIVVAIVAITGIGSVISVVALLYGATQVLSPPRYVGFHEIGVGLIAAGVTMAASILLYNVAIRLIPYIYVKMGKLLKFFTRKLVSFTKNTVKGVEQL